MSNGNFVTKDNIYIKDGICHFDILIKTGTVTVLFSEDKLPLVLGKSLSIHIHIYTGEFRVKITFDCKKRNFARYLTDAPKDLIVDHRNLNTLDNTNGNLRICNNPTNLMNAKSRKNTSSIYKGVYRIKRCKSSFQAHIKKDYKRIYLGCFKTEIEAALAYDKAARELHGEFGRYNFPLEGEQSALQENP